MIVAFYSCIVCLFPLLDYWSARIICCVVSELMFLLALLVILLFGLRIFVYDCDPVTNEMCYYIVFFYIYVYIIN
jgi:hypothetical protein